MYYVLYIIITGIADLPLIDKNHRETCSIVKLWYRGFLKTFALFIIRLGAPIVSHIKKD